MTTVLFGASNQGRSLITFQGLHEQDGYLLVDNDPEKWGSLVAGMTVRRPTVGLLAEANWVLITSMWVKEIYVQLTGAGVLPQRIVVPSKSIIRPNTGPDFSDPAIRSLVLEMLDATFSDLAKEGVTAYLDFGTLLGLWRDDGPIEGDGDIDLSVIERRRDDFLQVSSAVARWADGRMPFMRRRHADSDSVILDLGGPRLPVNVSRCVIMNDEIRYPQNEHLDPVPAAVVLPTSSHPTFTNLALPHRVEEYLELRYGSDWRTPDPDWGYVYGLESLGLKIITSMNQLSGSS